MVLSFLLLSSCKGTTFQPKDEQTVFNQPGRVIAGRGRLNRSPSSTLKHQWRGPRDGPGTPELQNPPWLRPWVAPSVYRILRRWTWWTVYSHELFLGIQRILNSKQCPSCPRNRRYQKELCILVSSRKLKWTRVKWSGVCLLERKKSALWVTFQSHRITETKIMRFL